ncbi:hypothetical protein ACIF85_04825 [Streptomyces sp. NPDC086033]|uniref:hypothetical protein n=1 Tax=Streptomyces sp. NPDC086033 TaxID=3365747 RepID=UPI0037D502E3
MRAGGARGAWVRIGVTAVLVMVVVGCDSGDDLVVDGTAPSAPYDGPLNVPTRELGEYTPQALRLASGAAGRALECAGEIHNGSGPDGWSRDDGGDSPEEGLKLYFDVFDPGDPRAGYRVERRETDRVLYSYDVDGRTKVAVVVAKDQRGRPGWGPETSASCDPSELPADWTDSHGYEIWTDRAGERVPTTEVSSGPGDDHCGRREVHFLDLGERTYAGDPEGLLDPGMLTTAYDGSADLPAGAHDTGYRYADRQLWLTNDRRTAYVRTADGVEAWPRLKEHVACK